MANKYMQKRCDSCDQLFYILRAKTSHFQIIVIRHAQCPFCNPNVDSCSRCHVPFYIQEHHAKGFCMPCYMYVRRNKLDEE